MSDIDRKRLASLAVYLAERQRKYASQAACAAGYSSKRRVFQEHFRRFDLWREAVEKMLGDPDSME